VRRQIADNLNHTKVRGDLDAWMNTYLISHNAIGQCSLHALTSYGSNDQIREPRFKTNKQIKNCNL
jgi:hypothetical protein